MNHIILFFVAIWMIFLVAMMLSRSQTLQRFGVMEFLLVLILSCSAILGYALTVDNTTDEFFKMYSVYLQSADPFLEQLEKEREEEGEPDWMGRDEELDELLEQILPVTTTGDGEYRYMRAVLTELSQDGTYAPVVALDEGHPLWEDIEGVAQRCIQEFLSGVNVPGVNYYDLDFQGSMGIAVEMVRDRIAPRYALFVEMPMQMPDQQIEHARLLYVLGSLMLWGIGTLLIGIVVFVQGRGMRRLVNLTAKVAEGREEWDSFKKKAGKGFLESNEMRLFRNSLSQIAFDMTRMHYMRFRILQAYYRFAPKQIEKIFNKQSILDVGKSDRAHTVGTLAFVSFSIHTNLSEQRFIQQMSQNYSALGKAQKANGGIFFSGNNDLSTVLFLFNEETANALQFGVDMTFEGEQDGRGRTFALLHRGAYIYGVAGDESQAYTYVLSREMKVLEQYVDRLCALGIPMAVTDAVYEVVRRETMARYIGFIEDGGQSFKLYEILDASPARERQNKIDTQEKFQKALNLFYQGDFYLARGQFSDVLKESPGDEVAKRYLFLCEKCLNREGEEEVSCALFS